MGLAGYLGYKNGLVNEVSGMIYFLIFFIISFKIVSIFMELIHHYLFQFHKDGPIIMASYIAFTLSVVLTFVTFKLVTKYLKIEVDYDLPGIWDNAVGAVISIFKFLVILSFFFWFITGFGELNKSMLSASKTYGFIQSLGPTILNVDSKDGEKIEDVILRWVDLHDATGANEVVPEAETAQ